MFQRRALSFAFARRHVVTAVRRAVPNVRPSVSSLSNENTEPVPLPRREAPATTAKSSGYGKPLSDAFKGYSLESKAPVLDHPGQQQGINWAVSFHGLGSRPFEDVVQVELSKPIASEDIEIKPDGLIYLPEIKYRRILNKTFGAGGWGLVPRSETSVTDKLVTREYALVCHGQLVSLARGEQDYFADSGIPTATEGCKSNALMRCCKDLGIGSELWDPVFIKSFKKTHCTDKFVEHVTTKKKRKIWLRKDREVEYPYK
ncbi:LANO_0B00672g1_1 [Lachancea nothofagi CBS 11611]|uniref:Mitochondrial genome maintenance protein MGM101 n=1 Tax=Lachancea nothofagi CBS 11611 TaxID=1266666 RepID=A0A1G4IUM1_9SACH|nr:LANO_0B00672g1_1 [Lachancea nothofagi CBS 11611]